MRVTLTFVEPNFAFTQSETVIKCKIKWVEHVEHGLPLHLCVAMQGMLQRTTVKIVVTHHWHSMQCHIHYK